MIAEVEMDDEPEFGFCHDSAGTHAVGRRAEGEPVRVVLTERHFEHAGVELALLIAAAQTAAAADAELDRAAHAARHAGASWTQIGDAVGLTRQAAQQRWGAIGHRDTQPKT